MVAEALGEHERASEHAAESENDERERKETVTVHTNTRQRVGTIGKTKALAAGILLVAMLIAGTMAASAALAATTFTVNSTADAPDAFTTSNTCDTDVFTNGDQCTLRAAIEQANATPGADVINIPVLTGGTGS